MLRKLVHILGVGLVALVFVPSTTWAQSAPDLTDLQTFAVLGGSAVTAAGGAGTTISGNVGSAPTPSVSGFPPAVVSAGFTVYKAAAAATAAARTRATAARVNLAGQTCPAANVISGGTLGGKNLVPGVYCMPTGNLTGTLTLTGGAADVWVFQMTLDTLTTAASSIVTMAGGASSCNVYWQVSSSATLGANSTFRGNIFAGASIGMGTTANVVGRAIAGSGAVTMDGSDTVGGCSTAASCPVITVNPTTLPGGTILTPYSQTITASGGVAPYTYALSAGALPGGLTLSAAGVVSGTPTTAGTFSFTVRASDENGCFGDRAYTIAIVSAAVCPPIAISPAALDSIQVGVDDASFAIIRGSGGTAPYTFAVTAGSLPAGVLLSDAGRLSGKPTTAGLSTFTVRGTDAVGCFAERAYTLLITAAGSVCPPISITPATLTDATQGVAYSKTIAGHGGAAPYTFAVTSGVLPAGLTLSTAGVLSGTPTVPGPYEFTIVGTDANGCLQVISYTFTVISAVPTLPEWAMIILMMLLGVAGFAAVRRRARAE